MKKIGRFIPTLAGVLLAGAPWAFGSSTWHAPTAEERALKEDPSRGIVGAVYLEKRIESRQEVYRVYVRAKILSTAGYDAATVDDLSQDASEIEGRTVSPAGLITALSTSEIRTITTVKAAGVTLRRKGFTMPAVEPGCFIEYAYREEGALGSRNEYHAEILFQDKYPVLREELRFPTKSRYASMIRYEKGVQIESRRDGPQFVFEAHDVPAVHPEPFGLPEGERSAGVIFSYFFEDLRASTVDEYWKNATRLALVPSIRKTIARPSKVRDILKEIPGSHSSDPAARLRGLYRYVQKTLKNEAVLAAGDTPPPGGWKKNTDASDTLAHKSGEPADLAAVFLSMAKADGWQCRPIFVPDRQERLFRREIPSIFQFDTWIVEVRDPGLPAPVALSFEHPLLSFGEVPWNHLDADGDAVDLDRETAEVVHISQASPAANLQERQWQLRVTAAGNLELERRSRWTGQQAFRVRSEIFRIGRAQYEKDRREELQRLDPPAELESLEFANETDPDQDLHSTLRYSRTRPSPWVAGGRVIFSPLSFIGEANPLTQSRRTEPMRFPYPHVDRDTFTIQLPEGAVVDELPQGILNDGEVGRYAVQVRKGEGATVVVERTFELKKSYAGAESYPLYRGLFESAARGDVEFSISFRVPVTKGRS
jgi:hypothetical protein